MSPAFSIVIPASDSTSELARLLPALAALEAPSGGFEVIVADEGRGGEGIEQVVASHSGALAIRLVPHCGMGRSRCRELGWRTAKGDAIVFLDPNMMVGPGWLVAYQRALQSGADVVSGARRWGDGEVVWGALELELESICQRSAGVLQAFAAQAANLAVRRPALERTCGFNVLLRELEDVELGIRLWQSGARFAYSSDASAAHEGPRAWPDNVDMQALFWRHPYGDLLRLQVWARRVETGAAPVRPSSWDRGWDSEELRRELGEAGPAPQTWTEADLVAQLARNLAVPVAEMQEQISKGVANGLYHEVRDGVRYFQLDRLEDWLRDATPYLQRNYHNDQVLVMFRDNPDVTTPAMLSVRGRIQLSVDPQALAAAGVDRINLALPFERSGLHAVQIAQASTPSVLDAARKARNGVLAGLSVAEVAGGTVWVDFTFEVAAALAGGEDGVDPATQLRVVMPPEYQQRAQEILRVVGSRNDPFETGKAIFEWLENHILFGGLPPQHPYYRVLDFGAGICIQQIRLFVAMCRLAGIPAREVCGALLPMGGEEAGEVTKELRTRGFSPFGHSWAEFYVPGRGWVPTELRGFGRRGFVPLTVPDPALRKEFQRVLYERYPFGTLHPYRIVTSPQANRLSPLQFPAAAEPVATKRAVDSIACDVVCTFSRPA